VFGAVAIVLLPPGSELRFLVAVPLLFFLPGYAVIALLYPAADSLPVGDMDQTLSRGALSFGLSLAVVPILVLIIGAVAPPGLTEVLGGIGAGTLLIAQLAAVRRARIPGQRRYQPNITAAFQRGQDTLTGRSRAATFAVVLLVTGVILTPGAIVLAMSSPPDAQEFSQFYVGTEDQNGNLTTVEYPDELTAETSLTFVVENHEQTTEEYVVVVQLQEVNDTGAVRLNEELGRYEKTVEHGETWRQLHEHAPELTGECLRLQYLLYRDEPPATPTGDNAYRSLHIWVTVR